MFTMDVKYVALTVGVLGVAIWGVVGSGWHYARAAGPGLIVHQKEDALTRLKPPTDAPPAALVATPEIPVDVAAVEAATAAPDLSAAPAEATSAVTVLDDVYYDANREALVVPFSGAAPQASPVYRERDGLAFIDFSQARTAFGRPRFKRQPDAAFKSYILNTRPGVDRARLSFVVARPGALQVEAGAGELVVRLAQP